MTTIPLTLSDAELAAYREKRLELLVRLAEECGPCEGSGYVLCTDPDSRSFDPCLACNGTGYRNPLGESGDVLEITNNWATEPHIPRLTRTDEGRVVRLQDVTAKECIEAGGPDDMSWCYGPACPGGDDGCNAKGCLGVREAYSKIWNRNNPEHPWGSNPWVGVGGVK